VAARTELLNQWFMMEITIRGTCVHATMPTVGRADDGVTVIAVNWGFQPRG